MKEKGIDLSSKRPKGLNDLPPIEMNYLVIMGCEETCPPTWQKRPSSGKFPTPKENRLISSKISEI
jgi:hypothetical protein